MHATGSAGRPQPAPVLRRLEWERSLSGELQRPMLPTVLGALTTQSMGARQLTRPDADETLFAARPAAPVATRIQAIAAPARTH